ncbi:MAG: hypothetical protein DMF87_15245, partial [Acidobacteria bacterium]
MDDVRRAHHHGAEALQRALVETDERIEAVDLLARTALDAEAGVLHLRARDVLDAIAARHLDLLEQHVRVGAGGFRDHLLGAVLNVP